MLIDSTSHIQWLKDGKEETSLFFSSIVSQLLKTWKEALIVPTLAYRGTTFIETSRQHPFHYMQFVTAGQLTIRHLLTKDCVQETVLSPGDGYYSPPYGWDFRPVESERDLLGIALYPEFTGIVLTRYRLPPIVSERYFHCLPTIEPELIATAAAIDGCIRKGNRKAMKALLKGLLLMVNHSLINESSSADKGSYLWQNLYSWICENYCTPITREDAAAAFNISGDHVSRLFRENHQTSFNTFLRSIRMQQAEKLLKNPRVRIKDITELCGYNNSDTFTRAFKKHFGYAPSKRPQN